MKNNYSIRRNAPDLPPARIDAHRDFETLLARHEAVRSRPAPRRLWLGLSALAASVLIAWLLFRPAASVPYPQYEQRYFAQQEASVVPLEVARPVFASRRVVASEGGVLDYPSGSRVVVPRAAFATSRGAAITGEVAVHFRELRDYLDLFRGGVPLRYDSAGVNYDFASVGLVEIYAEQNGERLVLAPNKRLEVSLAGEWGSHAPGAVPRYGVYRLDTAARRWVYRTDSDREVIRPEPPVNRAPSYPVAQLLSNWQASHPAPVAPTPPSRGRAGEPVFALDLSELVKDTDGLAALRELSPRTLWQLAPGATATPQDLSRRNWPSATVVRRDDRTYELTLIAPDETLRVSLQPVLEGAAYEAARANFERAQAAYLLALQNYRQDRAEYEERLRAEARRRDQAHRQQADAHAEGHQRVAVRHRFVADALGTWQVARPVATPPTSAVVRFTDATGRPYVDRPVYVADRNTGTLRRYVATAGTELRFFPDHAYLLWLVTEEEQIAVWPSRRLPVTDESMALAEPVPVADVAELRRVLGW